MKIDRHETVTPPSQRGKVLLGLLGGPMLCYVIFAACLLFGVLVQGIIDKVATEIGMPPKEPSSVTFWGVIAGVAVTFGGVAINLAVLIVKTPAIRAMVGFWLGLPATYFAISVYNVAANKYHQQPYGTTEIAVFFVLIVSVVSLWAVHWEKAGKTTPSTAKGEEQQSLPTCTKDAIVNEKMERDIDEGAFCITCNAPIKAGATTCKKCGSTQ